MRRLQLSLVCLLVIFGVAEVCPGIALAVERVPVRLNGSVYQEGTDLVVGFALYDRAGHETAVDGSFTLWIWSASSPAAIKPDGVVLASKNITAQDFKSWIELKKDGSGIGRYEYFLRVPLAELFSTLEMQPAVGNFKVTIVFQGGRMPKPLSQGLMFWIK